MDTACEDFLARLYCIDFTPWSRIVRIGACFVRVLCMHCIIYVYFALIGRVHTNCTSARVHLNIEQLESCTEQVVKI